VGTTHGAGSFEAGVVEGPRAKARCGLGGLMECQSCGAVGAAVAGMRHRNCLWVCLT
jgi:hypothetical protein